MNLELPYLLGDGPDHISQFLDHQVNALKTWFSKTSNLCLDYGFKRHIRC